jgi:hypothetical protein
MEKTWALRPICQPQSMKKNIQISIPKPCHENWNSFTKTSSGGFCSSCQKEVIDFTSWSDDRIQSYFKNLKGSSCGRFREGQLKVYSYDDPKKTPYGWLPVFFASGLLFFSARQSFGQQRHDFAHHPTEQYMHDDSAKSVAIKPSALTVTGVVTSPEEGMTMPGVNVILKGTEQRTFTDGDGKFSITLTNPGASPVLVFSFIGFKVLEHPVSTAVAEQQVLIKLLLDHEALEEKIIVGGCYPMRWYSPRTGG